MTGYRQHFSNAGDTVRWIGLGAGPLLALLVYWLTADAALSAAGRTTAGVGVLMAVWWMTEAMPLPATALLPIVLFPVLGVMPVGDATAPYASHVIFLFLGGFLIGLAMQRWQLHRRIALAVVGGVGTQPARLVGGFMLASALLSMWLSNTATTIMLLPVGASVLATLGENAGPDEDRELANLGTALMLGIAYAASIGGLGTLLGSPPNLVLANFAAAELDTEIGMLAWMAWGLPAVAVLLPLAWWYLAVRRYPARLADGGAGARAIEEARRNLGPMSRGEKIVLAVFTATATGWVLRPTLDDLPGLAGLSDAGIAMAGALALFLIPVSPRDRVFAMDWESTRDLPWGILLLFGGGLSLAQAISASGLDAWIAGGLGALAGMPLALVLLVVITVVVLLTELSSNTATANTFIPILAAVAAGLALPQLPVLVAAALAASCAFMLPVATPPNAIVFSSGYVAIGQMARTGLVLNLLAIAMLWALILLWAD